MTARRPKNSAGMRPDSFKSATPPGGFDRPSGNRGLAGQDRTGRNGLLANRTRLFRFFRPEE